MFIITNFSVARQCDDAFLWPANLTGPFSVWRQILLACAMRSTQALSWLGIEKLYIGASIIRTSALRNSSISKSFCAVSLRWFGVQFFGSLELIS
uniref:hypothetical protein n=1 Tax=Candidatus Nitrotoga sp. 1052 TaxID=2886964 RepID=UPI001EF585A9|nr:hypothetical protein [Candidatus Nitrotoga sp. 1052]